MHIGCFNMLLHFYCGTCVMTVEQANDRKENKVEVWWFVGFVWLIELGLGFLLLGGFLLWFGFGFFRSVYNPHQRAGVWHVASISVEHH